MKSTATNPIDKNLARIAPEPVWSHSGYSPEQTEKALEQHRANARLIASAPSLLAENKRLREALKRLVYCPDLNLDELETETEEAIDQAANALVPLDDALSESGVEA